MSDLSRQHLEHMARIEAKLDLVIDGLAQERRHTERLGTAQSQAEKRMRSLERWRHAPGGALFISLASIVTSLANSTPR
ncbi:hypothetical protein ACFWIB_16970 [Streptomyces sp. NPDC127051]|uniref:hypothetical protein n=1 Tax=Streptomyces sp. NPDC127051 TaxID=3347119 RepID=UPI003664B68B